MINILLLQNFITAENFAARLAQTKNLLVASLFVGWSYFNNDGSQKYLIFQPTCKTIRIRLEFKGNCLKQDKAPFIPNNVVNLYIVYVLNIQSQDLNAELTLKYYLFGALKQTKNANSNKELDLIFVKFFKFQILIEIKMSLFLKLI